MSPPGGRIDFPEMGLNRVIIAVKGLPYTGKSELAKCVGEWARCPVLYADDFLETLSLEKAYTAESLPSVEEAERIQALASDALYKITKRHLNRSHRVVIDSSLCSTSEFDLLIRLVNESDCINHAIIIVIIIECRIQNEYRWKSRMETELRWYGPNWYSPRSWDDIEKAMDDDEDRIDPQVLDLRLLSDLKGKWEAAYYNPRVTRLVLDTYDDLKASTNFFSFKLTPAFQDAIRYLLDWHKGKVSQSLAPVYVERLQFDELRRRLLEMELSASRKRRKYICTSTSTKIGSCVFKPCAFIDDKEDGVYCCEGCEERVASGQPAYTCHFCTLTLHKSCAEMLDFNFLQHMHDPPRGDFFYSLDFYKLREKHACKSCTEEGKRFSKKCESCLFKTHLRFGMLPTIVNHDCHELHFLSIQFARTSNTCKACGLGNYADGYICHRCNFFYHLKCVFLPGEVKQEHGGHEHVMKLKYSHDGMEQEDDHWCNVCYDDMDPQNWFYSCQECPYYITHASIKCAGKERILEAVRNRNLPIRRSEDPEASLRMMKPFDYLTWYETPRFDVFSI